VSAAAISTQKVVLGDVIDIRDGTHDTPAYVESGIPLITSKNLSDAGLTFASASFISEADHAQISKRSGVQKGDVLYGMIGTIGKPTLVEVDRAFSIKNIALFKQAIGVVDSKYLRWLLDSPDVNAQIARVSKGGTQKFVALGALRGLTVHLPPLEEQCRIAAILDQAETLRTQRRQALAHLDTLTQSLFLDMFGDPVTNPMGWSFVALDQLIRDGDTINYGVIQPGDALDEGVPLVRVGDVVDRNFDPGALKRIDPTIEAAYKRSRLRGDEILVTCVGSIGVVALVDSSMTGFNIARAVSRIPASDKVNRVFLASYLQTEHVQRYFTSELRTVSQPTLNIKQICETKVIQPPLALQQTFATRIQAIEALKATHRTALGQLDALFASLQQRSFAGEL
jgi:type I restriction enzyme S subunit